MFRVSTIRGAIMCGFEVVSHLTLLFVCAPKWAGYRWLPLFPVVRRLCWTDHHAERPRDLRFQFHMQETMENTGRDSNFTAGAHNAATHHFGLHDSAPSHADPTREALILKWLQRTPRPTPLSTHRLRHAIKLQTTSQRIHVKLSSMTALSPQQWKPTNKRSSSAQHQTQP